MPPHTSITDLCSAVDSQLTITDPIKSEQPQLPADPVKSEQPQPPENPGDAYLNYIYSNGYAMNGFRWEYAMHLKYGPLTLQDYEQKVREEHLRRWDAMYKTLDAKYKPKVRSCKILFPHVCRPVAPQTGLKASSAFEPFTAHL